MATSNTQRTIRELRNQGRVCAIVEKWNQFVGPHGVRQDLFGIIDVLALDPQRGVVGVQSCGSDFAAHERKLLTERAQECIDWLSTPGTVLELWGWRKVKLKRGGKAERWQPRIREFTLADFGLSGAVCDDGERGVTPAGQASEASQAP
jgi:hypothetical protein